jgi:hypothetical protein
LRLSLRISGWRESPAAWLNLWSLGVMRTFITNQHRDLFIVLFWIFEVAFVASEVVIFCADSPFHPETLNAAAQIIWLVSFIGLFIFSFLLRWSARYLANIGWLTLFGAIFIAMAFPRL